MKEIAVSGGFDPIHIGHVRMFREAQKLGKLFILLNSDRFLRDKKGYVFMPLEERKEMLEQWGIVIPVIDSDNTVRETLRAMKPDIFVNGGDRVEGSVPEEAVCKELNIKMLYGIGGTGIESSSDYINRVCKQLQ